MTRAKVTIPYLFEKKAKKEPITMLTCYDYPMALLEEKAEIDIILCGDSLGMTVYGYNGTLPVTMDMMVVHAAAVTRGAPTAFVIGDMPFLSYQVCKEEAVRNAGRFMQEAGTDAIKLEGGLVVADTVRAIVNAGIPVMAHLGLTPQSIYQFGTYKVRAKEDEEAEKLIRDAKLVEQLGCFALVLEKIPADLAKKVSESISIPTIGIGAGPHCDGQVLVYHDMVGMNKDFSPKFLRRYLDLYTEITGAVAQYVKDVKEVSFPNEKESY